ncbi:hypothetical protein Q4S45_18415 [Massilia sp. R2A-15]|uniref:hypothetical protein n=1 Tax=Massilia sp. R2A-15 TaxID=3064278 RepID=UPI00273693BF|nr:hypothetical protein [Massilia sp. R2A-15]WLI88672.1 hypothetical protein Q4S45_18415 [Massilia sp. R2A-15]
MTFKFTRPALAIALALTLAACGGKASFTVGGTIEGLQYDGLVLATNGMSLAVPRNATTFSFPNTLSYGEVYEVSATAQPAHQSCVVGAFVDAANKVHGGAKDTAGRLAVIDVGVRCALTTQTLTVKITGLTSDGLQLTNGNDQLTITPLATGGDVSATFAGGVAYGVTYGVTVLTQPTKQVCTVSGGAGSGEGTSNPNGTGTMGDKPVSDLLVTCK